MSNAVDPTPESEIRDPRSRVAARAAYGVRRVLGLWMWILDLGTGPLGRRGTGGFSGVGVGVSVGVGVL